MSGKTTVCTNNKSYTIHCVVAHDERWYRAKAVAVALGHKNTQKAVIDHVIIDNQRED